MWFFYTRLWIVCYLLAIEVKGLHRILYVFSNFNYSVAVKINVSNSYCLKQESQAILLMLKLADKRKFFCVVVNIS